MASSTAARAGSAEALIAVAAVCFPVLLVATTCGVLVAIVQAATQVQEQTLTLLPKLRSLWHTLDQHTKDSYMEAIVSLQDFHGPGVSRVTAPTETAPSRTYIRPFQAKAINF